jgi:PAS domain S-box-containing protein
MSPARDDPELLRADRRRLEASAARTEARLRTVQELVQVGSYEIGIPAGPDDYWSDEMYRITGVAAGRPPLDPLAFVSEVVHPDDRTRVAAEIERVLAQGVPFDFEYRVRRPDGTVSWVRSVGRPIRGTDGRVTAVVGSLLDVTERRRSLEVVRGSEARATAFLESAGEAVLVVDAAGRIVLVNRRAVETFGFEREELLGRNVEMLLPDRLRGAHARHRAGFFTAPRMRPMGQGLDLIGRCKDGREFPIEVSLSFVDTDEGRFAMSFVTDISARRAVEKALEAARREAQQRERLADVGALTAKIAHDFGNPIAGLSMSVQQIARRLARDPGDVLESVRPAIEHMAAAVRRLDALTHDFKAFLRGQRLEPISLHLGDFVRDLVSVWAPEARRRKIALALEVGEGDPTLRADPDQLRRLFDNLVKNALEAIGHGPGTVTIAAELGDAQSVRVLVADTGPGVSPGTNVFGLFETSKADGTGLGLTIAKQVAEAHGGGIQVAAATPHGAVFEVDLPRAGPPV